MDPPKNPEEAEICEPRSGIDVCRTGDLRTLSRDGRSAVRWQHLLLVAWFGLLSYGPMLQPYVLAIDDYQFSQMARMGPAAYLQDAFEQRGAWRLLQHGIIGWMVNFDPLLPGVIAVACHIVTCQFFYLVFCRFARNRNDALLLALMAACSPFGFQGIAWMSGFPYVLNSVFLWISLWMFIQIKLISNWVWLLWGIIFAASLLVHDNLLFALSSVAAAAWLGDPSQNNWKADWLRPSIRWFPGLIGCVYLAAYFYFKPTDHLLYFEPHVHWPSLVGPMARLWQWLDIWAPLIHPPLWDVAASEWPLGWIGLSLCVLAGLTAVWVAPSASESLTETGQGKANRGIVAMAWLFLMASLIHVAAGGYSLDSRKRYPLFLFFLGSGGLITLRWAQGRLSSWKPWQRRGILCAFLTIQMFTCWLHVGLWQAEARSTRLLSDFMATNPTLHVVYASKLVDPWKVCPTLGRLHGQPWMDSFYVAQPFVMDHPGKALPVILDTPRPDIPALVYDYRVRQWMTTPALSPP